MDAQEPAAGVPPAVDDEHPVRTLETGGPVRYEIVFDSRDRMVGARLVTRVVEVIGPTFPVTRGDEGPTWSVTIEFPDAEAADRFFSSDFYRQFCIEVRRSATSSVLVVPLGTADS